MLRNDPADDAETDRGRNNAGVAFGQLIASSGVLVVNDPTSLANALSTRPTSSTSPRSSARARSSRATRP